MSATPQRIRLSRAKGFNLQAASQALNGLPAVKVDRGTPWGNPFVIGRDVSNAAGAVRMFRLWLEGALDREPGMCPDLEFRDRIMTDGKHGLRGINLACWCPLGAPCHADVLLEIANREPTT